MHRPRIALLASLFAVVAAASLAGCGGSGSDSSPAAGAFTSAPAEARTASAAAALPLVAAGKLPALNIDPARTAVSGLSSGAFMAGQLHVAYSTTFRAGAGILAGGPYSCAMNSVAIALTACMKADETIKPQTPLLIATADLWAQQGLIDETKNLAGSRVYLYSGTLDSTVKQRGMDEALAWYRNYLPDAAIAYRRDLPAEHAMPTMDWGNGCAVNATPYVNDCDFDLAGEMLRWIHGDMKPRRDADRLKGRFVDFDQQAFLPDAALHGLGATGVLYLPEDCEKGQRCTLHVALHGCQQDRTKIGDKFYRRAGYVEWADSNGIAVLFPQTAPSSAGNPNGCWDWWGYDDPRYAQRAGRQMAAVKGMVDALSAGARR